MPLKQFQQFKLLFFKNVKTTLRSGSDLFWELFIPLMIVGLLLWIRGLAETEIVTKPTTNDHIDISVWPPGLHPPYSENFTDEWGDEVIKSEFIIAYAPENNKTRELVEQRMLDRLKVDVMRYSNEEAIIEMLVEAMWKKIQEMDEAKNVTSCNDLIDLLNKSFPVPILEKDVDWCQEFDNNTEKVENVDGNGGKNVWNDDNKNLVNDNIILPEINGILWDPCKRQTIFTALYEMKNNVLCDVPEERIVENDSSSFFGMLFDGLTASPDDYDYNGTDYNSETYDDTTTQEPRVTEISDKQYHLNYLESRKQEHIRIMNQSMHDVLGSIWSKRKSVGEVFSASKKERKASRMDDFSDPDNLSSLIDTIHENMIKLKYDTLNTVFLNIGNLAWNKICGEITAVEPKFNIKIQGFPSWEKFEEWTDNKTNEDKVKNTLAGIQFHENEFHENRGLNYSLRMRPTRHNYQGGFQARMRSSMENDHEIGRNWVTNQVLMPMQMSMPRSSFRPSSWCTGGRPYYYNEGFLSIQRALDKSYIDFITDQRNQEESGNFAEYEHSFLKILPYGPYNNDVYPTILQSFIVFMIMTSYIRLAFNIAKNVVTEKETKIKEYMKTMGTGTYIQWFAWFVHYFIITSIMNGLFVGLTTSKTTSEFSRYLCNLVRDNPINADAEPIIQFSNPLCLWVVIQVYLVETIWQIFFLTTFFDQASTAAGISGFVHFISYTPWNNIMRAYKTSFPLLAKHLLCFIPLLGNAQSWWIIGLLEGKTEGLQWSNFNAYMVSKNDMTILNCLLTQLFFTIVYAIMTFYVELIRPGLWGVSKPWYFPVVYFFDLFKISDKTKTKLFSSLEIMQKSDEEKCLNSHKYYESLSKQDSQNIAIQIHNIRKIYSNGKLAVDGLELEMVKGQITALLGHNGAGKTTTMNMLIGMLAPSSGYAKINGHDIRCDLDVIRKNLGICPQFDILFTLLTVEEHLRFFSEMKSGKVDENDVEDIIGRMGLGRYRKNYPSELSGGWKRRVSVAIALVGGSDVIVLDEPTSGMDPSTRRILWETLRGFKKDRTIILSTHFMDEADILGDRIAIMSKGKLVSCGSSMYLKNLFGCGYHLILNVSNNLSDKEQRTITNLVKKYVPEARLEHCIEQDLSMVLPYDSVVRFKQLLHSLDQRLVELKIEGYGIVQTSLEEVFMLCNDIEKFEELRDAAKKKRLKTSTSSPDMSGRVKSSNSVSDVKANYPLKMNVCSQTSISDSLDGLNQRFDSSKPDFRTKTSTLNSQISISSEKQAVFDSEETETDFVKLDFRTDQKTGLSLIIQQFSALVIKNIKVAIRDWPILVAQIMVPVAVLYITMATKDLASVYTTVNMGPLDVGYEGYKEVLQHTKVVPIVHEDDSWYNRRKFYFENSSSVDYSAVQDKSCYEYNGLCIEKIGNDLSNFTEDAVKYFKKIGVSGFDQKVLFGLGYGGQVQNLSNPNSEINQDGNVFALFNGQHWHTPAGSVNMLSNQELFDKLGGKNYNPILRINTINNPLKANKTEEMIRGQISSGGLNFGVTFATRMLFPMAFVCAAMSIYPVKEHITKAKHVQLLTGLHPATYWAASYAVDILKCIFVISPSTALLYFSGDDVFGWGHQWIYFMFYLWLVCFGMLPLMYLFSRFFAQTATALVTLTVLSFVGGSVVTITVVMMKAIMSDDSIADGVHDFFTVSYPAYTFTSLVRLHYTNNETQRFCTKSQAMEVICETQLKDQFKYTENYLDWEEPGVGKYVLILLSQGVFFYCLLVSVDTWLGRLWRSLEVQISFIKKMLGFVFKFLAWMCCCPCMGCKVVLKKFCARNVPVDNSEEEDMVEMKLTKIETEMDEDVARERDRVKEIIENSGGVKSDERVLLASDLKKTYSTRTGPLKAVRGLNLCMRQGECFGLLGVNGAGKTTTFKMMTGDEEITGGEVYVNRYSIKTARSEAQQQIGYCPQFNALIESLTAYETLELFSKLRGMKPEFIEHQSDQILKLLGLKIHAEHRCGTYSGGNKRKLSVGLAMVGQPALLFLDEPSTGMDPGARHALWEALSTIRKQGTSIVVTSHSMEECEALCTRLGIMVNGQFKALGSLQHLKNKFGRGYTLELQLNNISSGDKVKTFIESNFKTACLKEEFSSQITYDIMVNGVQKSDDDTNVENSDISLGRIFGLMEENKEELDLQGYSLCQRTLEQIFLGFTKLQSN